MRQVNCPRQKPETDGAVISAREPIPAPLRFLFAIVAMLLRHVRRAAAVNRAETERAFQAWLADTDLAGGEGRRRVAQDLRRVRSAA